MVGKLARWLRILGFDTAYSNACTDDEILRLAEAENRMILTRDAPLAARPSPMERLLIESNDYQAQLRQVISRFGLKDFHPFSRCLECNVPLEDADKEAVFERVPPYVYLTQTHFALCPSCQRVFWRGTHVENMIRKL